MPKMIPKGQIQHIYNKVENNNTKEIKKKLDGLDKKIKPEASDY